MVTNSRKVKITCGNDEFVVKGVVFDKDGVLTGGFDLWKQIFYLYMKVASQKGLCVEKLAIDLLASMKILQLHRCLVHYGRG